MTAIDEAKQYRCPGCGAEPGQECYALNMDLGVAIPRDPEDCNWVHTYRQKAMRFSQAKALMEASL